MTEAARGLEFLILDELHAYRDRQGADVAQLVREFRDTCDAAEVQCVGTSATMTTEGELARAIRSLDGSWSVGSVICVAHEVADTAD